MFKINATTGAVTMHAGDTGSFKVHATRETGDEWSSDDRMMLTVTSPSGQVVIQRYYRLDTELGDGYALIQFHNDDTDGFGAGVYSMERRYIIGPSWDGTAPTGDVTDALAEGVAHIVNGAVVRTPKGTGQTTLEILRVYGEV